MKVGVFHWAFDFYGGGEYVAVSLAKALGLQKVYSLFSSGNRDGIEIVDVSEYLPLWARLFGKITKRKRALEYWLWEMLPVTELGEFDVVLTSGVTPRSVLTPEDVLHINYCHSPPRWLWDLWEFRWKRAKNSLKIFFFAELFRRTDIIVDSRVDYYFVNSELIKRRLWKYLKRDSEVLYPPIHTKKYHNKESEEFVLHMGRFDVEKQILPVIKACEKAGVNLVMTGYKGTDKTAYDYALKSDVVDFRGYVSEEEKIDLLSRCKAVIYNPINEDFGIIPTEAFASGKPVIVNHTGYPPLLVSRTGYIENDGILKIYRGGIITRGDENTIAKAIHLLDRFEFDADYLRSFAKQFDFSVFKVKLEMQLELWWRKFNEMLEGEKCLR